jgi:hypothetical protein
LDGDRQQAVVGSADLVTGSNAFEVPAPMVPADILAGDFTVRQHTRWQAQWSFHPTILPSEIYEIRGSAALATTKSAPLLKRRKALTRQTPMMMRGGIAELATILSKMAVKPITNKLQLD